jgi:hypothetical protein
LKAFLRFGILSRLDGLKDFHTITHSKNRLNRLKQSNFRIFPYFAQNAGKQGKLSRGLPRSILGHLKPFKRIPRKKPCFFGFLSLSFVFL